MHINTHNGFSVHATSRWGLWIKPYRRNGAFIIFVQIDIWTSFYVQLKFGRA